MFIDTNVLVRARFTVAPEHSLARARLRDAIGGAERTRISRQIVREYLAVVTRPQTWSAPLVMSEALRDVGWFLSTFDVLEDGPDVTRMLIALCREVPVAGRQSTMRISWRPCLRTVNGACSRSTRTTFSGITIASNLSIRQ